MKSGDLIKHKRSDAVGIIVKISTQQKEKLATVFFADSKKPSTAPLKILEENWEIIK